MKTISKKYVMATLGLAAALLITAPNPAQAKSIMGIGMGNNNFPVGWGIFGNNSAARDGQKTYQNALKQANDTYKSAVKAANNKLVSAYKTAGRDLTQRIAAYRTYLSDILAAMHQRSVATESALQAYINALSNVQATNHAPAADAQSVTVTKNTAKSITLTGSDVDANTLSFYVLTNPAHGTLSGTVPNLTYLPATDYTGTDSFTFKVNDGTQDSPTATISITVNP